MREGLRSANKPVTPEKDKILPSHAVGEKEEADLKQKGFDLNEELILDDDSVPDEEPLVSSPREDIKAELRNGVEEECRGSGSMGECKFFELAENGRKRSRVDGSDDDEGDGTKGKKVKEACSDSEVQTVVRVLRSRSVVKIEGSKEGNEEKNGVSLFGKRRGRSNDSEKGGVVMEKDETDQSDGKVEVKGGKQVIQPVVGESDGGESQQSDGEVRKSVKRKRGRPPKVLARIKVESDQPDGEVEKERIRLGRPTKVQENVGDASDQSNGMVKEVEPKQGRPLKEQDSNLNADVRKEVKLDQDRPLKLEENDGDVSDRSGSEVRKETLKHERQAELHEGSGVNSGQSHCDLKMEVESKRGQCPTVQESDQKDSEQAFGEVRKEVKRKRGRPPKVQQRDGVESYKQGRPINVVPKKGRPPKGQKSDGGVSSQSDSKMRKIKRKRGRPCKVQQIDGAYNAKLNKKGKLRKIKKGLKLGMRLRQNIQGNKSISEKGHSGGELDIKSSMPAKMEKCVDIETEDNGTSFAQISKGKNRLKNNKMTRKGRKKTNEKIEVGQSRRGARDAVRDRIVEILLAADWTIDYRPRRGREYNDAVYVSPEGKTHWSVTLAYRKFVEHYEDGHGKPDFIFTPIPPEELNILTRVVTKRRVGKKNLQQDGEDEDMADEVTEKRRRKRKLRNEKLNCVTSSGGKSLKGHGRRKILVCDKENSASNLQKGTAVRNRKRPETQNRKRCALLVRSSIEGSESDNNGYVLYDGKRTVLTWMIDLGTVPLNGKVRYLNRRGRRAILEGRITREGINCDCCAETFTVLKFEIHAGSKLGQPFQNIYLETGASLWHCLLESWNRQEESKRKGFHFVDVGGEDPNDDTCGICGDGGDLICCDGCPSTFHQSCLDIEKFPSGDWHCVYCSCEFCGVIGDNAVASALSRCCLCEEKYHKSCIEAKDAITDDPNSPPFCGKKCQELFERLQMLLGVRHELQDGFSWTFVRRSDVHSNVSFGETPMKVECNSKLAVALLVMDECFLPLVDHRSGVNLIHNIVYNFGSNFNRLNYSGFLTAILERGDEIICAASIRIHGNHLAEMPFIGTRYKYRRQGMCRRLLSGIESALCFLNVEKLVIPAISELRETWTSVFGFQPLELSSKQKMRKMNMLVFPGVDMLQKPILQDPLAEKNVIPAEGLNVTSFKEKGIISEVANNTDDRCSVGCVLNVLSDYIDHHTCDGSAVESGSQLPCHSMNDTSGLTSETTDLKRLGPSEEIRLNQEGITKAIESGGQLVLASSEATDGGAKNLQSRDSIVEHGINLHGEHSTRHSDEIIKTQPQDLAFVHGLKLGGENFDAHYLEGKSQMSHYKDSCQQLQVTKCPSDFGEMKPETDEVNNVSCVLPGDSNPASTEFASYQMLSKTNEISSNVVDKTSLSASEGPHEASNGYCGLLSCETALSSSYPGNKHDRPGGMVWGKDNAAFEPRASEDTTRKPYVEPCIRVGLCKPTLVVSQESAMDDVRDPKEASTAAHSDFLTLDGDSVLNGPQKSNESYEHPAPDPQVDHSSAQCNSGSGSSVGLHCVSGGGNACGPEVLILSNHST